MKFFFIVFFFLFSLVELEIIEINTKEESYCNYKVCPPNKGYCKVDTCICFEGFMTNKEELPQVYCNYEQKHTMTALLLETFGLIGFGHIYSGRYGSGILKMIIFYAIICFGTQFVIQFMKENTDSDVAYYIKIVISLICIGTPIVWHFIDLYNWACDNYKDGNGMPMIDW